MLASTALAALGSASAADLSSPPPSDTPKIFNELRFGVTGSVQSDHEAGATADVQVLFNPFGYNPTGDWQDQLAHPRIHFGASVGTTHTAAKQLYGGLTWTLTSSSGFFTEAGFGSFVHDGNLTDENDGPKLGCHLLFHEYLGASYNFDSHCSLMAQINHSSYANLYDGPNAGMTRAGLLVGYKF
ncbi:MULTISPECIES: acyloxyacyl hydrolase [unclassified Rhizobium]|uniref:acyloxyacyl hydrolase n=1 Tax=unclassified Rhizobium TaxID=2613769 RepID=UPI001ADB836B|nr:MULTISPECIES: acyloxyacyl hydrolase [unclassified Rhizobium]MBO9101934.1 acyloxyacyl hydrolase [Rhizobium sp. L58/93]MBO9172105.1 acyloxyacyl hydrolase [Rhizobium sp. L245/93]QXZ88321.1 acyloxyacyl hydrolase [Rhizobium sp. K1/93]QXZ94292.1 acyloxyacyl hydrolase [Rhizobium sp. K15/93]QYA05619.1 acyloxyacyl hydrolase [Rhizobium sp. B21/90]